MVRTVLEQRSLPITDVYVTVSRYVIHKFIYSVTGILLKTCVTVSIMVDDGKYVAPSFTT